MFVLKFYNEDRENIFTSFPQNSEETLRNAINFAQDSECSLYNLMVKEGAFFCTLSVGLSKVLIQFCIDDLIVSVNLDTLRDDSSVRELFKKIYPNFDIELYSDLKMNLANQSKEFFTKSYKDEVQNFKLHLDELTVSDKVYNYATTDLLRNESYNLNFFITNYANDSVAISGAPDYSSRYIRIDFRPISEITDYKFTLSNYQKDTLYSLDLCEVLSYRRHLSDTLIQDYPSTWI